MKILIASFEFPPQLGGIGTYTYNLSKHLTKLGNETYTLANTNYSTDEEIVEFDKHNNFVLERYSRNKNKIHKIAHRFWKTIKTVIKFKPQFLFITYSHTGFIALTMKLFFKTPYVITAHGSELLQKYWVMKMMMKMIFSKAEIIFCNSKYTASLVEQLISKQTRYPKIKIIPFGADADHFDKKNITSQISKKQLGYDKRKIILTVAGLRFIKGHHIVINALPKIIKSIPNTLYLIIGEGKEQHAIQQLVREKKLENYVKLLGAKNWRELRNYYLISDVVVLNSVQDNDGRREGFGITLLEANLAGKPIIGTKGSGIEDIIIDRFNGLLIPINNELATAEAIIRVLQNKAWGEELGENGYKRAIQNHTWEKVIEKTNITLKQHFGEQNN